VPINLVNGHLQNPQALAVPNGSITFQLNADATVIAAPYGFVSAETVATFSLDANGNILPPSGAAAAQIYSNLELNPQNNIGLGTYYLVTFYDQNNAALNQPMWWQFTQAANSTVDIGEIVPISTVGGNVIFYPTSGVNVPTPTLTSIGGVFANPGATNEWISAINTDGTVTLSQPSFSNISGTLSNAQLPSPITFTSITASGLITAQANLQLGVAGTTTGLITFEGGTSGAATITGPATAGTTTNPFAFSNSINLPSGTVYSINADTAISRVSAGVLAVGTGAAANAGGTINATTLSLLGKISLYGGIATAGQGTAPIYASASQTSQTASANIVSLTPAAAAGSYRIRIVISVGTASSAVLGWTATWTDSQGNAQSPTNLPIFQSNVGGTAATPALTFTTSSAGNYFGQADIDINNAATAIVVKFTLASGTVAAKVSASIEELI
jgi:hypothetical protein